MSGKIPNLLTSTEAVPCYVLSFTDASMARISEWIRRQIAAEVERVGVSVTSDRISRIVAALTKKIIHDLCELSMSRPIFDKAEEIEIAELFDNVIEGVWYAYFCEDPHGDGTAFLTDAQAEDGDLAAEHW